MAKAENKKISVNALERVVKDYASGGAEWAQDTVVHWAGLDVTIHRFISLRDLIGFAERVAQACFTNDTHEYVPEVKDLAIRSNILDTYANFTMPKNLEQQLQFVYGTDAVDMVLEHIDRKQFAELLRAIDAKIDYLVRTDIESVKRDAADAVAAINNIVERFNAVMGGMDPGDVQKVLDAVSANGGFDESKLVQAFMREKYGNGNEQDAGGDATEPDTPVVKAVV